MEPFHRQRDLLAPENLHDLDVDVVGAGSLGGAIVLCLGKIGFGIRNRITVSDFDVCEPHNLATQWFRPADVSLSRPKVDALADVAAWVLDHEIHTVRTRFSGAETRRIGPIVILAVDTLAERRSIWANLKERDDVRLLLDARAGAEVAEVWTLDLQSDPQDAYESGLQDEPFEEPCMRRSIAYTALGTAAFVGSLLRAWVRGDDYARRITFDFRNFWIQSDTPSGITSL